MPTGLTLLRPAATLAAAIYAVALGGCAPQPLLYPRYPDDPLAAAPIPPDRARVTVFQRNARGFCAAVTPKRLAWRPLRNAARVGLHIGWT